MSEILISKKDIINLLEKSFEDGYNGYLDMKEDCANKILSVYLASKPITKEYKSNNHISFDDSLYFGYGYNMPNLQDNNLSGNFTLTTGNSNYENLQYPNYNNVEVQTSSMFRDAQKQFNFIQGD